MSNTNSEVTEKEPINLAQIMASFIKAFRKLWFIMVIMMVIMGFVGYEPIFLF